MTTFEADVHQLMIISETDGRIVSFGFNPEEGFLMQAETYPPSSKKVVDAMFPFNVNCPKEVNLEEYRYKRIKITVELIEDDGNNKRKHRKGNCSSRTVCKGE